MTDVERGVAQKLILFFYFSMMDEARAQAVTFRAFREIKNILRLKKNISDDDLGAVIVTTAEKNLSKIRETGLVGHVSVLQGRIEIPAGSDWGPWFEFKKRSDQKEFLAVLWTKIIKIPESVVARGLGVSEGTIRYRTGRGLLALGDFVGGGGIGA